MWIVVLCHALACGGGGATTEGANPGECSDGADNDGDGAFDCNDSDCAGAPVCQSMDMGQSNTDVGGDSTVADLSEQGGDDMGSSITDASGNSDSGSGSTDLNDAGVVDMSLDQMADTGTGVVDMSLDQMADTGDAGGWQPPPSTCGPADEEVYEASGNNDPTTAPVIPEGQFSGGICTYGDLDFFQIQGNGTYQIDMEFDHSIGDLDMTTWNLASGEPNDLPRSDTVTDDESMIVSVAGSLVFVIVGYNSTNTYTLTLTKLP
jgi:hypothetical protein